MQKEKKILYKFLIFFLIGLLIVLYGIFHTIPVFAETVNDGYVTEKTQFLIDVPSSSAGAPITLNVNTTNNYGGIYQIWVNVSNITITKDLIYRLEIYTPNGHLQNINSLNVLGANGQLCEGIGITDLTNGYPKVYFRCKNNSNYISINLTNIDGSTSAITGSNFRWSYTYLTHYTEDDDIDLGPVISNATNNTNNIINNNNSNTNNIISNDNQNTDRIIEENKKNFNDCRDSVNLIDMDSITLSPGYLDNSGQIWNATTNNERTTSFIEVNPNTTYTFTLFKTSDSTTNGYWFGISGYSSNNANTFTETLYRATANNNHVSFTTGSNTNYVRISGRYFAGATELQLEKGSSSTQYEPYGEYCVNKLDEQNKTSKGILGKIGDLFNTLFSNEDADISGLNNMVGWLPPGPVDSIINLPLSLFNSLLNTITGTCNSVTLTLPFVNKTLTLPCFNAFMTEYLTGFTTLWTLIGTIISVFILYRYLLTLYKWIDDTLTLRENNLPGYYDDNWGGGA